MPGINMIDFDKVLRYLKVIDAEVNNIRSSAKSLKSAAESAESSLKDEKGRQRTGKLKDIADNIYKATAQGEEKVLELTREVTQWKDEYENLR